MNHGSNSYSFRMGLEPLINPIGSGGVWIRATNLKFNSSPLKSYRNPIIRKGSFSKHHFSGSMLNFGITSGVYISTVLVFKFTPRCKNHLVTLRPAVRLLLGEGIQTILPNKKHPETMKPSELILGVTLSTKIDISHMLFVWNIYLHLAG